MNRAAPLVATTALLASSALAYALLRCRREAANLRELLAAGEKALAGHDDDCKRLQAQLDLEQRERAADCKRLQAECETLQAECERLQAALTVSIRKENERALEAARNEEFVVEEREALEAAREALATRTAKSEADQAAIREQLAASHERSAELKRANAEKGAKLESLRLELDAMRQAKQQAREEADGLWNRLARQEAASADAPAVEAAADGGNDGSNGIATDESKAREERRAKAANDSARRRAKVNERRSLAAKAEAQLKDARLT